MEPLAGYRLISPLGRGGFGEVWKCEAPGGLFKAVKFVPGGSDGFRQERQAFEQIKSIRHPFLLTLERVEVVESDLVMVMELADGQLHDRMKECRASGAPGIPRKELLGYMLEAAEALDMIGAKFGLQHLDVKPANIFLVSGHAKVGDYGLVRRASRGGEKATEGGFTPKYTPPEVMLGKVDIRSDQYSLALVYAEMLTGEFPYPGTNANQLMMQHMRGVPDLTALPGCDRVAVAKALSKDPAGRFKSCLRFVSELINAVPTATDSGTIPNPAATTRPRASELDRTLPNGPPGTRVFRPSLPTTTPTAPLPPLQTTKSSAALLVRAQDRALPAVPVPHPTVPASPVPQPATAAGPADPFADLTLVMPAARLHAPRPRAIGPDEMPISEFVAAVVKVAAECGPTAAGNKSLGEQMRFLSTLPLNMMPHKVAVVAERWKLNSSKPEPGKILLKREYKEPPLRPGGPVYTRAGYEVLIELPTPPSGEVVATARLPNTADPTFARVARTELQEILEHVRTQLQTVQERRQHPRHRCDLPVLAFPLFTDGQVGKALHGRLADVSLGGARFVLPAEPGSDRLFLQFPDVPAVQRLAVYVRVLRTQTLPAGAGVVTVGRFRPDA
jgi:serine/threonine protein kinase